MHVINVCIIYPCPLHPWTTHLFASPMTAAGTTNPQPFLNKIKPASFASCWSGKFSPSLGACEVFKSGRRVASSLIWAMEMRMPHSAWGTAPAPAQGMSTGLCRAALCWEGWGDALGRAHLAPSWWFYYLVSGRSWGTWLNINLPLHLTDSVSLNTSCSCFTLTFPQGHLLSQRYSFLPQGSNVADPPSCLFCAPAPHFFERIFVFRPQMLHRQIQLPCMTIMCVWNSSLAFVLKKEKNRCLRQLSAQLSFCSRWVGVLRYFPALERQHAGSQANLTSSTSWMGSVATVPGCANHGCTPRLGARG